jgi:hypothetical protein
MNSSDNDAVVRRVVELKHEGESWAGIAAITGLTPGSARAKYRNFRAQSERATTGTDHPTETRFSENPISLEDFLAATKVDLTEWEIERWVGNKWEVGMKMASEELQGMGDKRKWVTIENVVTTPLYQIKVWFRPINADMRRTAKLKTALIEDIRHELRGHTIAPAAWPQRRAEYLFEYSPFDLHLGKMAWGEETVANYDVRIAEELFNASLDFLLEKALRCSGGSLDKILCVFGNDAMHVDSKKGDTTAGTHMDFDSRYIKVYRRLCQIHTRAVNLLRTVAPVDIVIVPGNHDELTSFHMGEILATRFENTAGDTVNNGPRLRKYYEYGVNLFGFTHGDAERIAELPLAMAREVPEMWARCPSREWHIGHLHKSDEWQDRKKPMMVQDLTSDKGIRIRRLTSLSGHDAWHTKHAYMDRRACEAFLFHKQAGFTDHMSFNVDHFTGKAISV